MKSDSKIGGSITKNDDDNGQDSKWDILQHDCVEEAQRHAGMMADIQLDFYERITKMDSPMEEKEFNAWESEYAQEYKKMIEETQLGNMVFEDVADNIQKMVAFPGSGQEKKLANTIEARSGKYYYDRIQSLKQAVKATSTDESFIKNELSPIEDFTKAVFTHVEFKYMDSDDVKAYGYKSYEEDRTRNHNIIIKKLNQLNDLARKYNTKPLMVRNLWPSDCVSKSRQTSAVQTILRYDRDIVEEYYAIAFPEAAKKSPLR